MTPFLFGKLPAFGDFVARGLSPPMRFWWDSWCSRAVLDARERFGEGFYDRYDATPPRRFLIDPQLPDGPWQAGCVVPSRDRAGRAFPFVLGLSSGSPIDTMEAAAIGGRLIACVENAFDRQTGPDALILTAQIAARDASLPVRAVQPVTARETNWIGKSPQVLEM